MASVQITINLLTFIVIYLFILKCSYCENRYNFGFLPNSGECFYTAISLPLSGPNEAYLGYVFELDYPFVNNDTSNEYPPIIGRYGRKLFYNSMESTITSEGYSGKNCILRMICEAGLHSISQYNGILGEIFHIILHISRPSTTEDEDISTDYQLAELHGRYQGDCAKYIKNCNLGILDFISLIENM